MNPREDTAMASVSVETWTKDGHCVDAWPADCIHPSSAGRTGLRATRIEGACADAGMVGLEPAGHDTVAQAPTTQPLKWLPNSYYRLRDSRLAARIASVEANGIRGEIFPVVRLRTVNGEPAVHSSEIEETEEWDLKGNSKSGPAHDLMKLIR
jgi:hypothetical protein